MLKKWLSTLIFGFAILVSTYPTAWAEEPQSFYVEEAVEKYYQGVPIGYFRKWRIPETNLSIALPAEWLGIRANPNNKYGLLIEYTPVSTYEDGHILRDKVEVYPNICVLKPQAFKENENLKMLVEQGRKNALKYRELKEKDISLVQTFQIGDQEAAYFTWRKQESFLFGSSWFTCDSREIYIPVSEKKYLIMSMTFFTGGAFCKPSFANAIDYQVLVEQYIIPSIQYEGEAGVE